MKKRKNKQVVVRTVSNIKKDRKVKVSQKFVIALSIVSIIGFLGIASKTILATDITNYVESLWMFVIGLGLIIEAKIKSLKSLSKKLTQDNFTHLVTAIIGGIAILAAIFSFPLLKIQIQNPTFLAIKGIISIIAIAIIIIQTWIIE